MNNNKMAITGVSGSVSAYVIASVLRQDRKAIVIVPGRVRSERLAEDLSFFCDRNIYVLPPDEEVFLKYEAKNQDQNIECAKIIKSFLSHDNGIIIAPSSGAIKRLLPHSIYEKKGINIKIGDVISFDSVKESLMTLGYERVDIVYAPGQFSTRGGIIDVFSPDMNHPCRIELFGDEIDSMRSFDSETQRSIENVDKIDIFPAKAFSDSLQSEGEDYEYIWNYMSKGDVFIEDPSRIKESLDLRFKELWNDLEYLVEKDQATKEEGRFITGYDDFEKVYSCESVYFLQPFARKIDGVDHYTELRNINVHPVTAYNGHMDLLLRDLKNYSEKDYDITITASSESRVVSLKDFIKENNLGSKVKVKQGYLSTGMILPEEDKCFISDRDIFDSAKIGGRKRKHKAASKGRAIQSFTELHQGEYVVHDNHGIGIFQGIVEMDDQGTIRDYIKIKYQGNGFLYVPVEHMDVVQKYIGSEGKSPKIHKLGSGEWKRAKQRARKAIAEMTDELIQLYAKRKAEGGYSFSEDTVWQAEFESSFPFEETYDQLKSIQEIKEDMEKDEPMDRLLCGDVGYGKTEVAARAIFKCLIEGKQAAMLVPTTILASQHFETLKERMKDYPFVIELMSRFRSDKEMTDIANKLKRGDVDFVIGTHRILSSDIKFKDLGLLVIDEEQRFGVNHKEKIKKLKAGIDVLTLSATPIPRTLNMSLTGIRDMSLITEPPEERYPVQTYVLEQDDDLIREVISRELDRGGQVFVVYNRVRGIVRIAERIRSLIPEAKVAVGHGQMNENSLEEVMKNFVSGDIDILVATTIVESGLDIPNANTLIVLDADKCGLSQLYQLRGRVGRSNRIAYAYLMYQKEKVLTEVAEKRLRAIREFTEFGAGFKIAMRDMELRGAGNVLGAEQSGHMMDIGYEMYARLVDEAARAARGEVIPERKKEFIIELKTNAHIPSWYIEDESVKIAMYKRIADIDNQDDYQDVLDEIMDRFGEIPKETLNLIKVSRLRSLAEKSKLSRIHEQNGKIYLSLIGENSISPYVVMSLGEVFGTRVLFHGGKDPYLLLTPEKNMKLDDTIKALEIINESA